CRAIFVTSTFADDGQSFDSLDTLTTEGNVGVPAVTTLLIGGSVVRTRGHIHTVMVTTVGLLHDVLVDQREEFAVLGLAVTHEDSPCTLTDTGQVAGDDHVEEA